MKKLVLAGIGLFMMAGFLPAKEQTIASHTHCFGTTCGVVYCSPDMPRELTDEEVLFVYDLAELLFCGVGPGD